MTQQKLRIMIADDQELIRESLSIILSQNADMEVTGLAENGAELLSLIKKAPPDIVLMDTSACRSSTAWRQRAP